jgi:hypothetical protein
LGKSSDIVFVGLDDVERQTLRATWPNARQATEFINQ